MSSEVDLSTPLTPEEIQYLTMRGRDEDIRRAYNMFGEPDDAAVYQTGDATGPEQLPVTVAEQAADRKRRLLAELAEIEAAEQAAAGEGDDSDDEVPPYSAWKVQDLDAELKARHLPVNGTKDQKAARLEEFDAEQERRAQNPQ